MNIAQPDLFADELPHGLIYQPDFISSDEEAALLKVFATLPFQQAHFQQYAARRRVVAYGEEGYAACYGPRIEEERPKLAIPEFLMSLRNKIAQRLDLNSGDFAHALISEYQPGTPIGWHTDAPHFEVVVGISLAGSARIRFRPIASKKEKNASIAVDLAPRSLYVMQGDIRWRWQHHIPPTKALRYSITMRTLCDRARVAKSDHVRN